MAARSGAPQIVVPHAADQFYWGGRVERLGVGVRSAHRSRLTTERLVRELECVLDNEVIEERARDLGERLRTRPPVDTAGAVLRSLGENV